MARPIKLGSNWAKAAPRKPSRKKTRPHKAAGQPKKLSQLEETLAFQIHACDLPRPEREYIFGRPRLFRFDFAWPSILLAVECEGGVWAPGSGGHTRPSFFYKDMQKYNLATELGWQLLRYDVKMIESGQAINQIERVILARIAAR